MPYAEININPYPNLLPSSESRIKVSQRLNELASGSVNVVELTPARDGGS